MSLLLRQGARVSHDRLCNQAEDGIDDTAPRPAQHIERVHERTGWGEASQDHGSHHRTSDRDNRCKAVPDPLHTQHERLRTWPREEPQPRDMFDMLLLCGKRCKSMSHPCRVFLSIEGHG